MMAEQVKYKCKCGQIFKLFKHLDRHAKANEFNFNCALCPCLFSSQDHRVRHYRTHHPNRSAPQTMQNTTLRGSSLNNEHFKTSEIRHLRIRRQRSAKQPTLPLPTSSSSLHSSPSQTSDADEINFTIEPLDWNKNDLAAPIASTLTSSLSSTEDILLTPLASPSMS